jgi:hypothetical protein
MPSVESRLAHRKHLHLRNREVLDREAAVATHQLRSSMDRDREDRDGKELRGRVLDAGERTERDECYAHQRAGAVQRLMGKHDAKSTAADESYAADIERIRRSGPTAGQHPVKRTPERGDAHFEVWRSLDGARQQAMVGVIEKFARLHDDADAEVLDLNRSGMQREDIRNARTIKSRYGAAGTKIGADLSKQLEDKHFRLFEAEHAELGSMARRYGREIEAERDRFARQNQERREMVDRHSREAAAHR